MNAEPIIDERLAVAITAAMAIKTLEAGAIANYREQEWDEVRGGGAKGSLWEKQQKRSILAFHRVRRACEAPLALTLHRIWLKCNVIDEFTIDAPQIRTW